MKENKIKIAAQHKQKKWGDEMDEKNKVIRLNINNESLKETKRLLEEIIKLAQEVKTLFK